MLKDKLLGYLKKLLYIDRSPAVMALSCSLGVFIGMTPYIGLQTVIALVCAFLFRLPAYPLVLGGYITNTFTIPPIFLGATQFGIWVLGADVTIPDDLNFLALKSLYGVAKQLFLPFMVGTHLLAVLLAVPTYFIAYYIFARFRKRRERTADYGTDNCDSER